MEKEEKEKEEEVERGEEATVGDDDGTGWLPDSQDSQRTEVEAGTCSPECMQVLPTPNFSTKEIHCIYMYMYIYICK